MYLSRCPEYPTHAEIRVQMDVLLMTELSTI